MTGLRKHEPVSVDKMRHVSPRNSICQEIRDIYWLAEGNEAIQMKARIAMAMAKSMADKLSGYQKNWYIELWESNPEFRQRMREARARQG